MPSEKNNDINWRGLGDLTNGDLLYYENGNWVRLPAGDVGNFLRGRGSAAPEWVEPPPPPPPVAYAGVDGVICEDGTFIVSTATASNYTSLNWTTSGTGSFLNGTTLTPTYTPSAADISAGTVNLTLTATGSGVDSDFMTLTVNQFAVAYAGVNDSVDAGINFTVSTATASNYSSLNWTTSGTGSFTGGTTLTPTYNPSAADDSAGSVTLTLTAYGNSPCGNDADGMTLTINAVSQATKGYTSGGYASTGLSGVVDKYTFASGGTATSHATLFIARNSVAGQSSLTYGYTSGGSTTVAVNYIDKFSFASGGTSTYVGSLTVARYYVTGQSSATHGYSMGGASGGLAGNTIDKFTFASDANATNVGNVSTASNAEMAGISSINTGYGYGTGYYVGTSIIDRISFSSDGNASDVGNLSVNRYQAAGQQSTTYGYTSGGRAPFLFPLDQNTIDKFSFTSGGNATNVGDLSSTRENAAGQSSATHGFSSGGYISTFMSIVDRFSFATDGNATGIGNLSVSRGYVAGQSG